jgi:predicted dienelactone hydrolase
VEKVNAGWRQIMVPDASGADRFPAIVCYPTADPETPRRLGPYAVCAAWDASPLSGEHPLVMLSHGSGSSPLVNRDLALSLARAGFVVGMPVHAGDNRDDRRLQGTLENLQQRPLHLQLATNALLGDPALYPADPPRRVALIGHSLGAYTALALAGGEPRTLATSSPGGATDRIAVAHDPRVSALVLLAPATVWFHAPGSLDRVRAPILILAGTQDTVTPSSHHADLVARQMPPSASLDYRQVAGAGHFSFLSVFPPEMQQPGFAPAQDPPDFDRAAFQHQLAAAIVSFLRGAALAERHDHEFTPSSPAHGARED